MEIVHEKENATDEQTESRLAEDINELLCLDGSVLIRNMDSKKDQQKLPGEFRNVTYLIRTRKIQTALK